MAIIVRKSVLFLLLLIYVSAVQKKLVENNLLSRGGDTLMGNISSMIEDGSLVSQFENADPKAIAQVIKILKGLITDANNEIARLLKNIKDALIAKNNAKRIHDATLIRLGEAKKAEQIAYKNLIIATDHHKMQEKIHAQKVPGLKKEVDTLQKAISILGHLGGVGKYSVFKNGCCSGRNELQTKHWSGKTAQQIVQKCKENCDSIKTCVSFEFFQVKKPSGCQFSTSCKKADTSCSGWGLYIKD